jgi:toxin YoeB
MSIEFTPNGWDDYLFWYDNDQEILDKINDLIKEIKRDAFKGIGKPEPLRGNLAGYWSRRISGEHRLVYRVHGTKPHQVLVIVKARFHY